LSDTAFGVESLAEEMAVSRSVLLKKIEALVGEPPSELIKRTRLTTAAQLIERRFGNISEIALEVGFSSPSHFADCFKRQFGTSPSHYHNVHAQQ
jgi:AraC-like DNA-binding protein